MSYSSAQPRKTPGSIGAAFEKHFRPQELSEIWGLSTNTIRRLFMYERGVVRLDNTGNGKRKYTTITIPQSVALRVYERLSNQSLQTPLTAGNHFALYASVTLTLECPRSRETSSS